MRVNSVIRNGSIVLALCLFFVAVQAKAADYDLEIDKTQSWVSTMAMYSSFNNPFDFIGQYHNYGLDVIIRNSESLVGDRPAWMTEMQRINQAFGKAHYDQLEALSTGAFDSILGLNGRAGDISDIESAYMTEITTILEEVDPEDIGATIESIEMVESSVMRDRGLNRFQKVRVLGFSSVTKYSFVYWLENLNDPSSPWQEIIDLEGGTTKAGPGIWGKIWKGIKIGLSDAAGFVVGFCTMDGFNADSGNVSVDLTVNIAGGVAGATVGSAAAAG